MGKKMIIGFSMLLWLVSFGFNHYQCQAKPAHQWKQDRLSFYLNQEANPATEKAVRYAFQKWDETTHFSFIYRGRNWAGLIRDGKNTVSFLHRWPKNIPMNKIAWCKTWYGLDGSIVESDIILNMRITKFTTLESDRPESYYIEGVLAHEIGHFIGLEHFKANDSVMKPQSSYRESFFKGNLDEKTIDEYRKVYQISE